MRFLAFVVFWALTGCAGGFEGPFASRSGAAGFDATVAAVKPVAETLCKEAQGGQRCDFKIVVDDRPGQPPNAFQSLDPSGQPVLTFTTGIIAQTKNPDELALIIAHEAAHHIAGHIGRQMRTLEGGPVSYALLVQAIAAAQGNQIDAARFGLVPAGPEVNQKAFELEADYLGAQIAARAGFNAARAALFFHRMPDPVQHAWSTHPSNAERYNAVLAVAGPARL